MSAETDDVRVPLLPLIDTSRDLVEMAETAEMTETETEMIGVVSLPRRRISIATCLDRIADHLALLSTLCRIQPNFRTKSASPTLANGGE
jgi:hypothetical protein